MSATGLSGFDDIRTIFETTSSKSMIYFPLFAFIHHDPTSFGHTVHLQEPELKSLLPLANAELGTNQPEFDFQLRDARLRLPISSFSLSLRNMAI